MGQHGAGTSPPSPIPLQPELASRVGPGRVTRPAADLGQPGMAKGMGWLQSQDKEARAGEGRHRHGCSVAHAGTQCQGRNCTAAPELRGGLQRRLLTALPHDGAVSPAMADPWLHSSITSELDGLEHRQPNTRGGRRRLQQHLVCSGPRHTRHFHDPWVRTPLTM